jgi:uncharacterized membrane protein
MSVGFALAAAVVFGTGDFLGGFAARRARLLSVLLFSQLSGLIALSGIALIVGGGPTGADLAAGAVAGLAGGAGLTMLYRGLATGTMALVAPVTGVVAAAVPVAAGLAMGERPAAIQFLGVAGAIVAVALLSGGRPAVGARLGGKPLLLALGSGLGFGAFYIALSKTGSGAGLWPVVLARCASVTAFSIAVLVSRRAPRLARNAVAPTIASGLFDVAANAFYLVAVHSGLLSVVAVLVSLYPASTVMCSLVFLGERLRPLQIGGVALALIAVALIAAG